MQDVSMVLDTATLHKPHVATHCHQAFVDTNITGTLTLLEEAVAARVDAFIFTSTTSTFGDALSPPAGSPAGRINAGVEPLAKNIYGVMKAAAKDLRNGGGQVLRCHISPAQRVLPLNSTLTTVNETLSVFADEGVARDANSLATNIAQL
jgi:NAD dependent epimerase/dehydratase family